MRLNLPNSCCLFLTMRQFADIEIEVFDVKDTKTDVAFVVALTNTHTHSTSRLENIDKSEELCFA